MHKLTTTTQPERMNYVGISPPLRNSAKAFLRKNCAPCGRIRGCGVPPQDWGGAPRPRLLLAERPVGGFTMLELLAVVAIIGILISLLLPAVQAARESARRLSCSNNLVQHIIAVQNYETFHRVYPPGTVDAKGPILNRPVGYHHNWVVQLLPLLERDTFYHHIDLQVGVYHQKNAPVRRLAIRLFNCPSDRRHNGYTNYAAVHHDVEAPIDVDNHGMFFLNSRVARNDVTDGLSHTLFLGEKLCEPGDLGWMSGTRATLRNTGEPINAARRLKATRNWTTPRLPPGLEPEGRDAETDSQLPDESGYDLGDALAARRAIRFVGGFSSYHPGVANFAFGDGSIRLLPSGVSARVLQQLGHRSDGELLDFE